VREVATPLVWGLAGLAPGIALVIGFGIFSELAVLWVVSYRLLTNPRRITK